jgi:hypothetical protein
MTYDDLGTDNEWAAHELALAASRSKRAWDEYDSAADWCARRGLKGKEGDALPTNLSSLALEYINEDPEAFERRVQEFAYGNAMAELNLPDGD